MTMSNHHPLSVDVATQLGIKMCEAWGINPAECMSIDVHWLPNQLPQATVMLMLNEQVVMELLTLSVVDRGTQTYG